MPVKVSYREYWLAWLALLIITLGMILMSLSPLPRSVLVSLLVAAMLAKATLIGGYFMHLRFEKPALVLSVVVGILLTGAALFVLIAPDGARILRLSVP